MSGESFWAAGEWNVQCFACGFKKKAGEVKRQWQGYYVCTKCWTPRQPQDFVKGVPDNPAPPFVQPLNWVYVGPHIPMYIITEDASANLITENAIPIVTE